MKSKAVRACAVGALLFTGTAFSGPPDIYYRWGVGVGTKPVRVYYGLPAECDNPVLRGLNEWNDVGAAFAFGWPSPYLTNTRESALPDSSDEASVQVEDGILADSTALMETRTTRRDGYIVDSDIFVNRNYVFYGPGPAGEFHCTAANTIPPPDLYDYESAVTHELGHALGFQVGQPEFQGDRTCVMYAYLQRGELNRTICAAEYNEMRSVYGVR